MTKTIWFLAPTVLIAGLTAACGQNTATAEAETEIAADAQAPAEIAVATTLAEDAKNTAAAAAVDTVAPSAPAPAATTVAALPLKRGFYVASDTPCGKSSNATTLLVGREGINGSRDQCVFKKIEKTGATTYQVTSQCSDGGAAWGHEETVETYTNTYEIPNATSFTVKHEDGSASSARYCAQSSMSPDFRDNDISDMTR